MSVTSTNSIALLKMGLQDVFARFYDAETAEVLADVHASYHMRFVQDLLKSGSPGLRPGRRNTVLQAASLSKRARRASAADALSPGPKTQALMDELADLVASAGECSMQDMQSLAYVLGAEPKVVRTAVGKLVAAGRLQRVGGDEDQPLARYRCV